MEIAYPLLFVTDVVLAAPPSATEATAATTANAAAALQFNQLSLTTNNVWMMLCTALVFIMHLGFAGVEAGFTQAKNTVNILFKNTLTPAIGLLMYALVGFNLMYPTGTDLNAFFNWPSFGLHLPEGYISGQYASGSYTFYTDFLFQAMFAATAATIVSGAVAERIKISGYLIFTLLFAGLLYPLMGMWHWSGKGFLSALEAPFHDFAGSTLVHSVGGWGALAGILVLGPRLGKYKGKQVIDKPGSSVPLATIGVFLLWLGWFGFNGGSVLSASPELTSLVLVNTTLGAAAGCIGGVLVATFVFDRLDLAMMLNGILAGLVGITAGADLFSPTEAMLIGFTCGGMVVVAAIAMDKLKLDDCVGAIPVHLVSGILGTLACGLLGSKAGLAQVGSQLIGIGSYAVAAFGSAYLLFWLINKSIGLRVSAQHEVEGLDSHEHGVRGYTLTYNE